MTEVNLALEELKKRVQQRGSQKAVAEELGIHPSYLNDILKGKTGLSDNVLAKLGYERVVVHVKSHQVPRVIREIEKSLGG